MRQALVLTAGFLPLFSGQQVYSQELPVFDDEDFEIVSVEPDSRVIARSNGRDFYCYAYENGAAGYVLVEFCLPFVSQSETTEADAKLAKAKAEEAKAKAEEADAVAAAEAIERQAVVDQQLASISRDMARQYVFRVARKHGCGLANSFSLSDTRTMVEDLYEYLMANSDLESANLDKVFYDRASSLFTEVLAGLEAEGKFEHSSDGTMMTLKDCK